MKNTASFRFVLPLLFMALTTSVQVRAASASTTMKCTSGPIAKQYGRTSWLVYGCEDGKSVLIVSAPSNSAVRFRFRFTADEDGYALHGEGRGDKKVTEAAYQELNSLDEADIQALVSEAKKFSEKKE